MSGWQSLDLQIEQVRMRQELDCMDTNRPEENKDSGEMLIYCIAQMHKTIF